MMALSGFKSFNLSVIFHVLLIAVLSLFIKSKENVEMIQKRTLISMDLGLFGNSGALTAKTKEVTKSSALSADKKISNTISPDQVSTFTKSADVESLNNEASGNGNVNSTVSGNSNGYGNSAGESQIFSSSILNFREPIYPKMAIRRGIQGVVKVRIKINSEGVPVETTILKSSGFEVLDQSAVSAVKNWLFVKRENAGFYFVEKNIVFEIEK